MGLFDWLFGKKIKDASHQKVKFNFLILDANESIPENKWFQKDTWNNKNFVSYRGTWDADWKWADEGKVKVAGISHGNRSEDFVRLACIEDFKMYLEDEPNNPISKNARKIMASATDNGELVSKHIGYLPSEIAENYAGVELDIRPAEAFLPTNSELNLGVQVSLLVRSARYLKKKVKKI